MSRRFLFSSFLSLCCVATFVGSHPAWADPADPLGGTGGLPLGGELTVQVVVVETGDPIPGAFVMVGPAPGNPFEGNVGTTSGSGEIVFNHASLVGTIDVTAGATDRAYLTVLDLAVSDVVLPLEPIELGATARLGDQFHGIEVNNGGWPYLGDGSIDFGLVFRAVTADVLLSQSGLLELFIPTAYEPLIIPAGSLGVPCNMYVPSQTEISAWHKLFYHLRVPTETKTLFGLSARTSAETLALLLATFDQDALLSFLAASTFTEMDILQNLNIVGDSDAFDLTADMPLTYNLTAQVSNALPETFVIAAASGHMTNANGEEEFIFTGFDTFDPDDVGSSATLDLASHPASGELSGMVHSAVIWHIYDAGDPASTVSCALGCGGSSVALARSGFTPPATVYFDQFYEIVQTELTAAVTLQWSDVVSATSPTARDLNRSSLVHEKVVPDPDEGGDTMTERRTYWSFYSPGSREQLALPVLPPSAPTGFPDPNGTPEQDVMTFMHQVYYLGDTVFDYDGFSFTDVQDYATHVSSNRLEFACHTQSEITGIEVTKNLGSGEITLIWDPSPSTCHDLFATRAYEIYTGSNPKPAVDPGAWPNDPLFVNATHLDLDGDLSNESFTHLPDPGLVLYLVTDRGLSGNTGPAGHYGSAAP